MKYTEFDDLTPEQRESILFGDACGHPTNRPKSIPDARKRLYRIQDGIIKGWTSPGTTISINTKLFK